MTLEMKLAGVKKSRNWMAKTASGEKTFLFFRTLNTKTISICKLRVFLFRVAFSVRFYICNFESFFDAI